MVWASVPGMYYMYWWPESQSEITCALMQHDVPANEPPNKPTFCCRSACPWAAFPQKLFGLFSWVSHDCSTASHRRWTIKGSASCICSQSALISFNWFDLISLYWIDFFWMNCYPGVSQRGMSIGAPDSRQQQGLCQSSPCCCSRSQVVNQAPLWMMASVKVLVRMMLMAWVIKKAPAKLKVSKDFVAKHCKVCNSCWCCPMLLTVTYTLNDIKMHAALLMV